MKLIEVLTGAKEDVRSVVSDPKIVFGSYVGVEIELEGIDWGKLKAMTYWEAVEDGSLYDNGAEFRFKQPLSGKDIVAAMEEFKKVISNQNPKVGEQCSVHVHVDARDITLEEAYRWVALHYCFEEVMFRLYGEGRKDTAFCIAADESPGYIEKIGEAFHKAFTEEEPHHLKNAGFSKYCSLNLKSLLTHGTMEVRLHTGCYDTDHLIEWINVLLSIKRRAVAGPIDFPDLFYRCSCSGHSCLVEEVFNPRLAQLFMREDYLSLFMNGLRIAEDFINSGNLSRSHFIADKEEEPLALTFVKKYKPELLEEEKERISRRIKTIRGGGTFRQDRGVAQRARPLRGLRRTSAIIPPDRFETGF